MNSLLLAICKFKAYLKITTRGELGKLQFIWPRSPDSVFQDGTKTSRCACYARPHSRSEYTRISKRNGTEPVNLDKLFTIE